MEEIKIVGSKGLHNLENVKDSVVLLGDKYYYRDSNLITKVAGRYYRKESPLIGVDYRGVYHLKPELITLSDGIYAHKDDKDVVMLVDGGYDHRQRTVVVNRQYYLIGDPRVYKCAYSNEFFLVSKNPDTPSLSESAYKTMKSRLFNPVFINDGIEHVDGYGWVMSKHVFRFIEGDVDVVKTLVSTDANARQRFITVLRPDICINPDTDLYTLRTINRGAGIYVNGNTPQFINRLPTGVYVHSSVYDIAMRIFEEQRIYHEEKTRDKVIDKINKSYSDPGPDENQSKTFRMDYRAYGGSEVLTITGKPQTGKKNDSTGGIGYTFGVEVETAAGYVLNEDCEKIGLGKVGDRSITSCEYVTPVLSGDKGMEYIDKMCELLSRECLVDDKCGVHVHVGGAKFNTKFATLALMLGCQIEEDMYKIMPPSRAPYEKYCASITHEGKSQKDGERWAGNFSNICLENWREVLGRFVFNETYRDEHADMELNRWVRSRYKWLNLVNCTSRSRFKTIEFRIFNSTTSSEKIKNFVLIALAFVHFVENHEDKIIAKGVTLDQVLSTAYCDKKELLESLMKFIQSRREKFNRTKVY